MIYRFNEHKEENNEERYRPIHSFTIKDKLSDKIWETDDIIMEPIREQLLTIANDLFDKLELDIKLEDIILTGSLANYNHSEYSDFDIHLLLDFKLINNDYEFVRKYADSIAAVWNLQHEIVIAGYDVEVYLQDINEIHNSTGQYSLLNNQWNIKPEISNFKPDEELIKIKSKSIMDRIDEISKSYEDGLDYETLITDIKRIFKKIKDGRKSGLVREGEYSIENLVFKLLRRNGYIEKIIDIRRESYDKKFK